MADLEDSQSPTWSGIVQGHQNLYEAVRHKLTWDSITDGKVKRYTINANPSPLLVRVRGVHMYEQHVIDESNRPIPASLLDLSLYLFHSARELVSKGLAPLLYIPKLQSFEEASLIHDVLKQIEVRLGIPYGTVRVTALIETLPGIVQAEEIGFALGPYWAGLNCGRWDYIFSTIKSLAGSSAAALPDRNLLTVELPFLTNYIQRIVQVCHSRGVHAMGGMSAFIPSKDAAENEKIFSKVVIDKEYEIKNGCDGAWVAHPGMVKTIQKVFADKLHNKPHQILTAAPVTTQFNASDFYLSGDHKFSPSQYSEAGLRKNISVGIQYLAAWLSGSGAVAIDGLMEDLATAEISRSQVWQWLKHQQRITLADGSVKPLDAHLFQTIFTAEVEGLKLAARSQGEQKVELLGKAAALFESLAKSSTFQPFIQDSVYSVLNANVPRPEQLKSKFVAHTFPEEEKQRLRGSRPDLTLDGRLATIRGRVFNEKMNQVRPDGIVAHGSFIGTPNGHSARNVVEGGLGLTWPYIGGWELNARGLVGLEQPMPDTLSVNFHEQGDLARVINRFLDVADKIQSLELQDKLDKIKSLPVEKQNQAKIDLVAKQIDYLTQPMLADLEQGWGDPKKVFYAVVRCLQHGVPIMHIEDQYSLKRCGHLGGKGLDDINGWIVTMKAANLAASIFDGVHLDGPNQNVNFVARTDALSAEFIQFSNHMYDKNHPDHPFIDWDRGFTEDGRYLYLKKGINPETGRKFGLEHSARRTAEIVKLGLATHVWMETPDAKIADAKQYMSLVQEHLAPHGVFARGLYNHSPSFVWDVNFFIESQDITKKVAEFVETTIYEPLNKEEISLEKAQWLVKQFFKNTGDRIRGDYNFSDDIIAQILGNAIDLVRGESAWRSTIEEQTKLLKELGPTLQSYKGQKELDRILNLGFRPLRHIAHSIVAQRLQNFKDRLADVGFEAHLCTLPLYPSDAYTASSLARGMTETGIHDFVINQRRARKYADATNNLTSFYHQRATGTGYEVAINKVVGTGNTDILHGSTEAADLAKEKSLKGSHDHGVSSGH